jgi:hypothetical protein
VSVDLAAWEHELRGRHGEWVKVANTAGARAEIGRQLDAQGERPESPLRGVLQYGVTGNRIIAHRDPATGHLDAGIRYTHQKRPVTQLHNIELEDVRVMPKRQGIGGRMLRELARTHPEARDMGVSGAVESAIPWYEKQGAQFARYQGKRYSHVGEWDKAAMKALREGGGPEMELAGGILDQIELGWRYDPMEHRNAHGEWSREGSSGDVPNSGMKWTGTGAQYKAPPADRVNIAGLKGSTHPFIAKYGLSTKNIVAAYDQSTPDERAQGMRWYSDAHDVAQAIGKGDTAKGAAMLSAFSVQTDWATDMMNAASTLANGKVPEHGVGITGTVRARAQAILDAKDDAEIAKLFPEAGSAKTRNFYKLIRNGGDTPDDSEGGVVIDRHALSVAAGRRLTSQETMAPTYAEIAKDHPDWTHEQMRAYRATFPDDPTGSIYSYQHIADMYRAAAKQVSDRDGIQISPHQMQAITWMHQLHANDADDARLVAAAADAVAHGGKFGSVPGAATAKGRASAMTKRWATVSAYAAAHSIPVHKGTTVMAGGILEQVYDLGGGLDFSWRDAWLHEARAPDGRWVHGAGGTPGIDISWGVKPGGTFSNDPDYRSDLGKIAGSIRSFKGSGKDQGHLLAAAIALENGSGDTARDQLAQAARTSRRNGASDDEVQQIQTWARAVNGAQNRASSRNGDNLGLGKENYPGEFSDSILQFWRKETDPQAKQELNLASANWGIGGPDSDPAGAALHLREAARLTSLHPDGGSDRAFEYRKLAARIETDAENKTSSQGVVTGFMQKMHGDVPQLLGGGKNTWNGNLELFDQRYSWRGDVELAEMDWDGHMEMKQSVADEIKNTLADPEHQVSDLDAFTVPLHEMIHATIPQDQDYEAQKDAYQNVAVADIEEGATELATIHHAGEFFSRVGVADRQTALVAPGGVDNPAWSAANDKLTTGLQDLENDLENDGRPPQAQAARHLQGVVDQLSMMGVPDPGEIGDVLTEVEHLGDEAAFAKARDLHAQLHRMARIPMALHSTLADLAKQKADPVAVSDGNAWGHYGTQTRDFQQWVQEIAKAEGHGDLRPGTPGYKRVVELSDEVNRQGAASKVKTMAAQAVRAMNVGSLPADVLAGIQASIEQSIMSEWSKTEDNRGKEAYRLAGRAARVAMQSMTSAQVSAA